VDTREVLEQAMELIASPDSWCILSLAEDPLGRTTNANDPSAMKWCALGALQRVLQTDMWRSSDHDQLNEAIKALNVAAFELLGREPNAYDKYAMPLVEWNNARTHDEVLVMFKQAIANLEGE
jgi:hypothetical protein